MPKVQIPLWQHVLMGVVQLLACPALFLFDLSSRNSTIARNVIALDSFGDPSDNPNTLAPVWTGLWYGESSMYKGNNGTNELLYMNLDGTFNGILALLDFCDEKEGQMFGVENLNGHLTVSNSTNAYLACVMPERFARCWRDDLVTWTMVVFFLLTYFATGDYTKPSGCLRCNWARTLLNSWRGSPRDEPRQEADIENQLNQVDPPAQIIGHRPRPSSRSTEAPRSDEVAGNAEIDEVDEGVRVVEL
jgi:hypothetical protein